jgi:predicted nuclease of predicted toxin-antitoxin system
MKLIVDANLSWRLIRFLNKLGAEAIYAESLNTPTCSDRDIWNYAQSYHYLILTQGTDFSDMVIETQDGPSVIWLRKGNLRNHEVESLLTTNWQLILDLAARGERLIEIL